jgi:hypothetical protein
MRRRRPAQLPQRFLQTLGQRGEALAALDRLDVLPAGERQPEVVEQVRERRAVDRHRQARRVSEVRQRARRMLLTEDQLLFRSLGRTPVCDPPLQRAQHTVGKPARMLPLQRLQNGGAAQMRDRPQQRNDLLRPDSCERVRTGPLAPGADSLAGQNRVAFQPPRRPFTEPRFRRRNRLRGAQSTLLHVPPHLAVGDRHSWHQPSPAIAGEG